jgi:hypothetical protein
VKVIFTKDWLPYKKGHIMHLTDTFWEANQMWRVAAPYNEKGATSKASGGSKQAEKHVDKPPADKMAKGQFSKTK